MEDEAATTGSVVSIVAEATRRTADRQIDLSAAVNPYGPPEAVLRALHTISAAELRAEPEAASARLTGVYAALLGRDASEFQAAPGISDILRVLAHDAGPAGARVPLPAPTSVLRIFGSSGFTGSNWRGRPTIDQIDQALDTAHLVVISNPNPITGTTADLDSLVEVARRHPAATLVVDETLVDFLPEPRSASLIGCDADNIVVLRSPGPFYGISAVRVAVAWCAEASALRALFGPGRVGGISGVDLAVAEMALFATGWAGASRRRLAEDLEWLNQAVRPLMSHPAGAGVRVPFRMIVTPVESGGSAPADLAAGFARMGVTVRTVLPDETRGFGGVRITAPRPSDRAAVLAAIDSLTHRLPPISQAG